MKQAQYYIRIDSSREKEFTEFLDRNSISYRQLSSDYNKTAMFSMKMNKEEAIIVKISFQTVGFLNFTNILGKQARSIALLLDKC